MIIKDWIDWVLDIFPSADGEQRLRVFKRIEKLEKEGVSKVLIKRLIKDMWGTE